MGIWNWLDQAMGLIYEVCHGGVRYWLYQGDGGDLWGPVMGVPDWIASGRWNQSVGRWDWFMGTCDTGWMEVMKLVHGDTHHWLERGNGVDSGRWDWIMGICDTGWIRAMELFHGDTRHWLERGNGVDLWLCVAMAGTGWWDWFRGTCHGGTWHFLDQGDGIDLWGCAVGHATRARHWGVTLAGTRHGGTTGSERWDGFVGARHGGATPAGCEWWDWFMGVFHGGAQLDRGNGIYLWRRTMTLARSGWGDWFMWAHHEGAPHWLDWGDGIDSWWRVEWQSTILLLNVNDKVLYGCWM